MGRGSHAYAVATAWMPRTDDGHDGVVATAQTSITHGNDPIIGGADAAARERTTDLLSALERSEVGAARSRRSRR